MSINATGRSLQQHETMVVSVNGEVTGASNIIDLLLTLTSTGSATFSVGS